MINTKAKGTSAERELIKMFWQNNWAAFRAAGSGSAQHACPDIIAGNVSRKLGIECKSTKDTRQSLSKKEINELLLFCATFGCEPWIGIRFDNKRWFFVNPEDLNENNKSFSTNLQNLKTKGVLFDELISF